jgi:hypothetical protein
MRIAAQVDLSDYSKDVDPKRYRRMRKTYINMLASEVPESFLLRFESEETALEELLDAIYGTMEAEDDELRA